jgi:hypothetical protein
VGVGAEHRWFWVWDTSGCGCLTRVVAGVGRKLSRAWDASCHGRETRVVTGAGCELSRARDVSCHKWIVVGPGDKLSRVRDTRAVAGARRCGTRVVASAGHGWLQAQDTDGRGHRTRTIVGSEHGWSWVQDLDSHRCRLQPVSMKK